MQVPRPCPVCDETPEAAQVDLMRNELLALADVFKEYGTLHSLKTADTKAQRKVNEAKAAANYALCGRAQTAAIVKPNMCMNEMKARAIEAFIAEAGIDASLATRYLIKLRDGKR